MKQIQMNFWLWIVVSVLYKNTVTAHPALQLHQYSEDDRPNSDPIRIDQQNHVNELKSYPPYPDHIRTPNEAKRHKSKSRKHNRNANNPTFKMTLLESYPSNLEFENSPYAAKVDCSKKRKHTKNFDQAFEASIPESYPTNPEIEIHTSKICQRKNKNQGIKDPLLETSPAESYTPFAEIGDTPNETKWKSRKARNNLIDLNGIGKIENENPAAIETFQHSNGIEEIQNQDQTAQEIVVDPNRVDETEQGAEETERDTMTPDGVDETEKNEGTVIEPDTVPTGVEEIENENQTPKEPGMVYYETEETEPVDQTLANSVMGQHAIDEIEKNDQTATELVVAPNGVEETEEDDQTATNERKKDEQADADADIVSSGFQVREPSDQIVKEAATVLNGVKETEENDLTAVEPDTVTNDLEEIIVNSMQNSESISNLNEEENKENNREDGLTSILPIDDLPISSGIINIEKPESDPRSTYGTDQTNIDSVPIPIDDENINKKIRSNSIPNKNRPVKLNSQGDVNSKVKNTFTHVRNNERKNDNAGTQVNANKKKRDCSLNLLSPNSCISENIVKKTSQSGNLLDLNETYSHADSISKSSYVHDSGDDISNSNFSNEISFMFDIASANPIVDTNTNSSNEISFMFDIAPANPIVDTNTNSSNEISFMFDTVPAAPKVDIIIKTNSSTLASIISNNSVSMVKTSGKLLLMYIGFGAFYIFSY